MHDVEKWLQDAPKIEAPEGFLERLMLRIESEEKALTLVRPKMAYTQIGYSLVASAAAMLLLYPAMPDIVNGFTQGLRAVTSWLTGIPL